MSPKLKKGIRWAISAAILVFLILFARTIDWYAAWSSMRHASMAMERLFDPIGFVMLLVFGVLVFELPPQFERWKVPAEILLVVIVVLLAFFVYATRRMKPEHVPERRAKPRTFMGKFRAYFV